MIQRLIPLLVLVLCGPLLAGEPDPPRSAEPVSVREIERMLRSGVREDVILMHVNTVGVSSQASTQDLKSLRSAGASDRLLDAILHPQETSPARVILRTDPDGQQVVHMTNLDDSGRRLGGEVARPARVNVVSETAARADRRPARRANPPPPPPEVEEYSGETYVEEEEEIESPVGEFPSLPVGTPVPHLLGATPSGFAPGLAVGFSPFALGSTWGLVAPVSPPGSWSHYLKHHHHDTTRIRRTRHIHSR